MSKKTATLFIMIIIAVGLTVSVQAQATRTWVSGVGDDVNPCSRTAPCKTWAGAISKTATNGIISALDPGGFGAVTITKGIMIDGTGQIAGGLASGSSEIVVNAPTTDTVVLRGLELHGANFTGVDGVHIISAKAVFIENCRIQNFSGSGVKAVPTSAGINVHVRNSDIRSNSIGGILVNPTAPGSVAMEVSDSAVSLNPGLGVEISGTNNSLTMTRTVVANNGSGVIIDQTSDTAFLESCTIVNNQNGIISGAPGAPVTRISRCLIANNTATGLSGSGTVVGFFNNVIVGNGGSNTVNSSVNQQ
jgi:parallel beta helix pectate lyase-like protein